MEVCHCSLNSPLQTANASPKVVMYDNSGSASDYVRSLRLIGNRIVGGCHSIYLNNTAYKTDNIACSSIIIDSNELSDAAYSGLYMTGANHLESFSHNFVSNYKNSGLSYTGVWLEKQQRADRIECNRIHIRHDKNAWGISLGHNLNSNDSNCMIANNEVVMLGSEAKYGIQLDENAKCHLLHNSVFVSGSTTVWALSGNEWFVCSHYGGACWVVFTMTMA